MVVSSSLDQRSAGDAGGIAVEAARLARVVDGVHHRHSGQTRHTVWIVNSGAAVRPVIEQDPCAGRSGQPNAAGPQPGQVGGFPGLDEGKAPTSRMKKRIPKPLAQSIFERVYAIALAGFAKILTKFLE